MTIFQVIFTIDILFFSRLSFFCLDCHLAIYFQLPHRLQEAFEFVSLLAGDNFVILNPLLEYKSEGVETLLVLKSNLLAFTNIVLTEQQD